MLSKKLGAESFCAFVFILIGVASLLGTASPVPPNSGTALPVVALRNGTGLAVAVSATVRIPGGVLNRPLLPGYGQEKLGSRDLIAQVTSELVSDRRQLRRKRVMTTSEKWI